MILEQGQIKLRAIEEKDLEILWSMMNDPSIEHMTVGKNPPISKKMQFDWILNYKNSESEVRFMVETERKNTIGMVSLTDIDWKNRVATVNYKRDPNAQGRIKGDMRAAVQLVIDYAFEDLNLHRLEEYILSYNEPSLRLAYAVGMQKEGVLRSRIYKAGNYSDEIVLGLLKSDWQKTKTVNSNSSNVK